MASRRSFRTVQTEARLRARLFSCYVPRETQNKRPAVESPAITQPPTPRPEPTPRLPRVLVFDSGVGGLSILAEIRARVPHCELVYACDNGAFPYGTKGEEELVARVDWVLKAL